MPEQFLHGADIVARLEQMGRKGVTQRVRGCRLREPGITNRLPHRSLERLIGKMLPPNDASAWITRARRRWKDILPNPFPTRARIFPRQGVRQPDVAKSGREIPSIKDGPNGDAKVKTSTKTLGYTIGGPVGTPGANNKLFFFYSHEYRPVTAAINNGNPIRMRVPIGRRRGSAATIPC